MRQRLQVLRDLRFELEEQRGEFVVGVSENVPSVAGDDHCAETLHHLQRVIGKRDRLFITRNAAAVVVVIEVTRVAADSFSLQRTGLEKLGVVAWQRMAD